MSPLPSTPISIAGLNRAPTVDDMEASSALFNSLPPAAHLPFISDDHLDELAELFNNYEVGNKFGLRLISSPYRTAYDQVMVGSNLTEEFGALSVTEPRKISYIDPQQVRGHIFMLTDDNEEVDMVPCSYYEGQPPPMSPQDQEFLREFSARVREKNTAWLLGLELLEPEGQLAETLEVGRPSDLGTFTVQDDVISIQTPSRVVGWRVTLGGDGKPIFVGWRRVATRDPDDVPPHEDEGYDAPFDQSTGRSTRAFLAARARANSYQPNLGQPKVRVYREVRMRARSEGRGRPRGSRRSRNRRNGRRSNVTREAALAHALVQMSQSGDGEDDGRVW